MFGEVLWVWSCLGVFVGDLLEFGICFEVCLELLLDILWVLIVLGVVLEFGIVLEFVWSFVLVLLEFPPPRLGVSV